MSEEPEVAERPAVPYAAITVKVRMADLGAVVPPLNQQVFAWLREHGIATAGDPFWKYNVIDMASELEIEAGVALAEPAEVEAPLHSGTLPAGRYATVLHIGHPRMLMDATARLLAWGDHQGLTWDASPAADGEHWGCRLEIYHSRPGQPMDEWPTELAFRLAD